MTMKSCTFFYFFTVVALSRGQFQPSSGPVYVNPEGGGAAAAARFDVPADAAPSGDRTTQTVYGFLDFTTTIGNTVMVFSPQSAAVSAEKKIEKTTEPVIKTQAPSTGPPDIQPSRTIQPEKGKSMEGKPPFDDLAAVSMVEPSKAHAVSYKVEVKEGSPTKVKKASKATTRKPEITDENNKPNSSQVDIKSEMSLVPQVVATQQKAVLSSQVRIVSNPKPLSSVVNILRSDERELQESQVELEANNIDKPEYDFLNRQPSEIVEENYKVIDLKPNSKFQLKPKSRVHGNGGKETRSTGLVTKMGGTIVQDGLTTVHETQVIGTYISGKYAQVLQSTHKVLPKAHKIAPSPTARILKTAAPAHPKGRVQLEPTPAGSLHEETALPLEALFHGDKNHIRPSRRPGPAVGGPAGKNEVKSRYRQRSKEQDTQEEQEDSVETSKRKFKPSSSKSSFRSGKSSSENQLPTVSVYSASTESPSGRKYQNSNRRSSTGKAKSSHEKDDASARRGYKPKIQTTSPDAAGSSTSLYKFKLQRPSGRWQYKTTAKPRITIRGREELANEVTSPSPPPALPDVDDEEDAERREDLLEEAKVEATTTTASTIRVSISTPPDFSDVYYEIATVKSPYVFQAGTVKNTRYITVTTTVEKTLHTIEPSLPLLSPTSTEPLTENILATTQPVYKENNLPLDSSIATLPPIHLGTDVETPPLETLTETFSTTQTLLKTHILPVIRDGTDTTRYTLVQTYNVARLVTATKTLPPMEVYQFVPSKTLKEFNTRLEEAGSELHLELEFGDDGNQEDDEDDDSPAGVRAFPPDLDLANIGSEFDVSAVDQTKLAEVLRQGKRLKQVTSTPKPTTEPPTTPLPPDQLQHLALLRLLNPNANIPQVITTSKPIVRLETIYESHVIPIINGASTSFSTLSRPLATVSKTDYETITSTITPPLPPTPLNPLFPPQPQFSLVSTPVVTNTIVTATESKVLKLTFGAKTAYTTLYSTRVVPTLLTTYLTTNVPVLPTAPAFPGYFPGAFPGFPGFG